MEYLIEQLIQQGYLKTSRIVEAFKKIKREDFVPEDLKHEADVNAPLPIGYGATISQPLTVAFMLELLQPKAGDKILDIGSGSGWTAALLAYCVSYQGKQGRVLAIERIPELVEFGKKNVAKYNFLEKGIVEFILGDGSKRLEKEAPFDKIIAAASTEEIPEIWKEQLKTGGRLVAPIKSSIWLITKENPSSAKATAGKFKEQEFPGFAFVPLIKNYET